QQKEIEQKKQQLQLLKQQREQQIKTQREEKEKIKQEKEEERRKKIEIEKRKNERRKILIALTPIINKATAIDKETKKQLNLIQQKISKLTKKVEIQKKKIPEKSKIVPVEKGKIVKKTVKKEIQPVIYKEPFNLGDFLRKNAFKFIFLLLLIAWFIELFLFTSRLKSPESRLEMIVGKTIEEKREQIQKKSPETISTESFVVKKEEINIEGERDPFSPGKLTMAVMKKLQPTNIVLTKEPEVITIVKKPKVVSILKEPPLMQSEEVSSIVKPTKPSSVSSSKEELSTIEKITKPSISPIIIQKEKCPLTYRGRMLFNGVEYFFIEGEKRTYRVTIGDIVEGFKILKKEEDKLFLSKNGEIYEINVF
ncbi:MAG TPA: hypothetical protein P5150_04960, partial [Candidatus Ratteibacteria bacterium]|nr:hypothetical protein [Candidatus Ratteibacteria bacterium]